MWHRLMSPHSRQEGRHGEGRRGQWPEVEKENGISARSSLTSCEQETGQCEALHNEQQAIEPLRCDGRTATVECDHMSA